MANYYRQYEVLWSNITITFRQRESDNGGSCWLGLGISRNNDNTLDNPATSFEMARQIPGWHTKMLNVGGNDGKKQCTISHFWSRKMIDKSQLVNNMAAAGTNPVYTEYFIPAYCVPTGSNNLGPNWVIIVTGKQIGRAHV